MARQQQLDLRHNGGVVKTSGAPGGGSGGDGGYRSGPLSGTFFGGNGVAVYRGFFTLQLVCSITPNPSSQMLSAISTLFANRRPGTTIFLGDTGAVIDGVSSGDCVYNRRPPRPWERYLMLGDGKCMPVGFYGDLDLDLHCEQDVRVTLTNVAVVPGLAFDIMSFNRMQERHEIILNRAGASMLGGRVRFKKFRAGNFIQATRVPHDDARPQPPAMVAAMMRPGPPSSMNVNDLHNYLGHANVKALYETAKQMGIKLTGIQEYCDGCAAAKAIKRTVPKVVDSPPASWSGVGPPAVVGASPTPPTSTHSVGAGAATGELLATEQEQEQLVAGGGRREVLAEVSRMGGGTSPVGPGALPAALPVSPAGMVHDGDAGGRWQRQRVTPAVTRSRAKRDGLRPRMFALMATQEGIARSITELSPPDVVEQELPSEPTCDLETPETYVQEHAGTHSGIWTEMEGKELKGLNATGTFEAAGSE